MRHGTNLLDLQLSLPTFQMKLIGMAINTCGKAQQHVARAAQAFSVITGIDFQPVRD